MVDRERYLFSLKEVCPAVISAFLPGWGFSAEKYRTHPERSEARLWTFESPVFEANTKQREGINMILGLKPDECKMSLELRVDYDRRLLIQDLPVNGIFLDESEIVIYNRDENEAGFIDNKQTKITFDPRNPTRAHFSMGDTMFNRASFYFAPLGHLEDKKVCLAPFGIPHKYNDGRLRRGPRR